MRKRKNKKHGFSKKKIIYGITAVAVIAAGVFLGFQLCRGNVIDSNLASQHRAVIIDQLGSFMPNQTFVEKATVLMEQANFTVDYFPSDSVTVDFYRKLPTHSYDIIIIRSHSSIGVVNGIPNFALFTSEKYSKNKYQYEQFTDRVANVKVDEEGESYFGIYPEFVRSSMKGGFNNAVIIVMGCGGTTYTSMAKAFLGRDVLAYFGWNERVDISHTDTATICLLDHLLIQNETMGEAIENTMNEVGPDPTYNSEFLCYGSADAIDAHILN